MSLYHTPPTNCETPTSKRKRLEGDSTSPERKRLDFESESPGTATKDEEHSQTNINTQSYPIIAVPPHSQDMEEMMKKMLNGQNSLIANLASVECKIDTLQASSDSMDAKFKVVQELLETHGEQILALETDMQEVKDTQSELRADLNKMATQFRDMKDAQLRSMEHTFDNYLILKEIPETESETTSELKIAVNKMIMQKVGVTALCNDATRVGKVGNGPRPVRVYWLDRAIRIYVLKNSKKFLPVKTAKDLPLPVRKVQQKIKTKGWELRQQGIQFEYRDLGLEIDKKFVHHEDLIPDTIDANRMDSL
jgi:hypothetical protein